MLETIENVIWGLIGTAILGCGLALALQVSGVAA
jgi:hypothetical protein